MPQDRRIRKSQQAIQDAFLELLESTSFEQVSVQQIAQLADVNRSTFYAHYLDKYDLLEKMEDESIAEIASYTTSESKNYEADFSEELIKNVMEKVIKHIDDHMDFYRISIENIGKESKLVDKLYNQIYNHLNHYKNESVSDDQKIPFDYFISYVSGAGLSMIQHWIKDPHRVDRETLVQTFYTIVSQGPAKIIRDKKI
ncbi:TetR/AcrR family transcriptional regulator [Staphylococcus simiae]|uniref:TetR/AcrR family transcriptional regulator n=1 Tax=Staphylococcus simiae TaxID=308354 RepID=UPI001A96283F|nr:TetR/AcrR family transcriptional regulator C-terminal domain-containing protein [Staphylococcus simiae]MBO1199015.1 TetR/AcrR family transcriptional regulator [Staphylococcus simiae]MBO1201283.1 TetR/AcrR family transcriptional regulator [Staphylococcus simiae]MBO1203473.1 TetR/AcrR family transcriptional regulator [Staphylococcus simiae]MBO1211001.1 TetR/AcrR family transcriptional regulator [Staphylococcus simiae]MBO1229621.1 TetR/AcrR family transcriptional regulator [Staphylococcus simi